MNGPQRAVLWIGLIMITFNLVRKWSEIKGVIFSSSAPPTTPSSGGGVSTVPGITPTPGKITLPFGGFPITVPLPLLQHDFIRPYLR